MLGIGVKVKAFSSAGVLSVGAPKHTLAFFAEVRFGAGGGTVLVGTLTAVVLVRGEVDTVSAAVS